MKTLRFIAQVLLHLLKTVSFQWIVNIVNILKRFWKALRRLCSFVKQPHAVQDQSKDCHTISEPAFHRPDPCIYSQYYLLKLGLPVTWDNPDIVLKRGGIVVSETTLLPSTQYEIDATIWNNSYEAPAIGLRVDFSYLSFGVATTSTPIGTTFVNLGVKGGANHPALATMLWTTPPTPGHYCLQVKLDWIDDANPDNNLGQNNVDVVAAHSPALFSFRLRNHTKTENSYSFQVDTYSIPELKDCTATIPPQDKGTFAERLRRIKTVHNRANFLIPPGWTVEITPPNVSLLPDQEVDIAVSITPPPGFVGKLPFNVNAVYGETYAGGVSLFVTKA